MRSINDQNKTNLIILCLFCISIILLAFGITASSLDFYWGRYLILTAVVCTLVLSGVYTVILFIRHNKKPMHFQLIRDYFWLLRYRASTLYIGNILTAPWFYLSSFSDTESTKSALEAIGMSLFPAKNSEVYEHLEIWVSPKCVVLITGSGCTDTERCSQVMKLVLLHVRRLRRQQPLNGILVHVTPHFLLHHPPYSEDIIKHFEMVCEFCRQVLPLVLFLSELDTLVGFSTFSRFFHKDELSQSWGAWREDEASDPVLWFELSWKKHSNEVYQTNCEVSGGNNRSIAFIFEFILLGHQLKVLFEHICTHNEKKWMSPRGYFLLGSLGSHVEDFLSAFCQKHYGISESRNSIQEPSPERCFNSAVDSSILIPMSHYAGFNFRASLLSKAIHRAGFLIWICAASGVSYWAYKNQKYSSEFSLRSLDAINNYIVGVTTLTNEEREQFTPVLENLKLLRQRVVEGRVIPQWMLITNWATMRIRHNTEAYYHDQLKRLVMPYNEKSLRLRLASGLKHHDPQITFENLHLYKMIFVSEGLHKNELTSVLMSSLSTEYNLSKYFTELLSQMQQDLFSNNDYPSVLPHNQYLALARNRLQGLSDEQLIFHRLKADPQFSRQVPVTDFTGANFDHVFSFRNNQSGGGTYIPVLFTNNTWLLDIFSENSSKITESLNDINLIQGGKLVTSPSRLSRTVNELGKQYVIEYISHWHSFIDSIQIKSLDTVEEQMNAIRFLSRWHTSPIIAILESLTRNTRYVQNEDNESNKFTFQLSKITEKFEPYHKIISGDQSQVYSSEFQDIFGKLYRKLEAQHLANNSLEAFNQLKEIGEGTHPLNALSILAKKMPDVINRWLNELIYQIIESQVTESRDYIQNLWLSEIVEPFQQSMAGKFPFSPLDASDGEASAKDFIDFFQPGGRADRFITMNLTPLLRNGVDKPILRDVTFVINRRVVRQIEQIHKIREAFFENDGSLRNHYNMRVRSISPNASHFFIEDNSNIITYNHGPSLWQPFDISYINDNYVKLSLYDNQKIITQKIYRGEWAWLKVFENSSSSAHPGRNSLNVTLLNEGQPVALEIRNSEPHINAPLPDPKFLMTFQIDEDLVPQFHKRTKVTATTEL
ncbi:hypothetical protein M3P05_02535 [Sansalvadorimonas sp. 2012CJ34-2]|uniref:IcmF-related N-terminal domain-containing protein n=1 Tax=Parendozoicomonas callyspongiae TaxID=2942213 RepID=A0ABT0PBS2_9GAMM|nr:ImcF-related family protein [Sansalvadorimonas sp. 2012CJ34-2]MCL6268827.1 hypothetical protein [Sansalvadorimonas sp. 2012CJ34-2]